MFTFWLSCAICNDVLVVKSEDGSIEYHGSSTDEITLVNAAKDFGFILTDRKGDIVTVMI